MGDVEWVDYNNNRFWFYLLFQMTLPKAKSTIDVNDEVERLLGSVINVRVGTELAIGVLAFRFGIEKRRQSPCRYKKVTTPIFAVYPPREDRFLSTWV